MNAWKNSMTFIPVHGTMPSCMKAIQWMKKRGKGEIQMNNKNTDFKDWMRETFTEDEVWDIAGGGIEGGGS